MFQDFDLAIRKDYRWPTRKPVRAPCIRPSPDIAGNRVGMGRLGAPSRRPYTQAIGEMSGRSDTSAHEWPELRGARGILSKLSWYSLNPCREACLFHRPAMLTDVDYWIACGGNDPSALGSMIPRTGHGRCSGVRQTAIAKSLGRNRA